MTEISMGMKQVPGIEISNNNIVITKDSTDILYISDLADISLTINKNVNASLFMKNIVGEIKLAVLENANLNITFVNTKDITSALNIQVSENATIKSMQILLDATNNKLECSLTGENANIDSQVLVINNNKKSELNQNITHNAKYTNSKINNIGVAVNGAKISFETVGKIINGMSKSNCSQLSRGLILGDSFVSTKPILLIDEYDVKAYHGASIGKMSDEELFYLMSRGLSKEEAFILILNGIIHPFIEGILIESEKDAVSSIVNNLL